jgi:hypothetical protein
VQTDGVLVTVAARGLVLIDEDTRGSDPRSLPVAVMIGSAREHEGRKLISLMESVGTTGKGRPRKRPMVLRCEDLRQGQIVGGEVQRVDQKIQEGGDQIREATNRLHGLRARSASQSIFEYCNEFILDKTKI